MAARRGALSLLASSPSGVLAAEEVVLHLPHPQYYVENHRDFLDASGEWLLDENGMLT